MTAPAARLAEPEARGLTAAEEALWLLQQLAPDRGVTNVAMAVEAAVQLRWWPLNATFEWLVDRHPALRCRFSTVDGRPVRTLVPADELDVSVDVIDGTDRLEERLREYAGRPFDLTSGRPVRLGWFRGGAGRDVFCLVAHHIVIDALSLRVLLAEFNASYPAFADAGEPPPLPEPARAARVTPSADSLRYWRADLAGIDPAGTRLDPAREPAQPATFAADEVEWVYPLTLSAQVADLRARSRSTDAAVLLAGYLVALHSVGMSDDALVGVMASTRSAARASSVGYHVATLPLRIKIDPDRPFVELASTVAARLIAGMEHADVPFEALASELVQGREDPLWWRAGLFRHLFNYRVAAEPQRSPSGRREVRDIHTGLCRFDIELTLEQLDGAFRARLLYSTEVHERTFAAALLERVESVIAQAHAAPALPLRDLDVRTRAEIDLLERVNRTQVRWAGPQTVPELVETAGRDTPDAVALVDGDRQVAYRELCQAAQGVRQALDRLGVRAGDVVALAGRRAPELAAAALGVWWAGAAYLPLDPEHPPSRLREQLADAGVGVVLDGQLLPEGCLDGLDATAVPVQWTTSEQEGAAAPAPSDPDALAYLIYTSGSTGRPKGVRITHRNLANVVRHFAAWLPAGPETTMLWLTTFAFDISALELWLPLSAGGRVVVGPDEVRVLPERLATLVERENVTVVQATPTTWRLGLAAGSGWLAGRTALCGGEPMPPSLARQLRAAGCRASNVYGPTETTIWSTAAPLDTEDPDRLTVGQPIANTRAYVLNAWGTPCPTGVTGELCLAGTGVAAGYHDRPELTAERFRDDPALGRYYRTGDLARLLPDGRIELLGRRDRQVKLRGHRIELGEVEQVLSAHDEVAAAAVILRTGPDGDGQLAAYVVAEDRPGLVDDVWAFARSRLPGYSLPARVMVLERLPETANGKVDLLALAGYDAPVAGSAAAPGEVRDPLERRLVDAWSAALGEPDLDAQANFFLYGGSSLLAAQTAEEISAWSDVPVSLGMMLAAPTPAALAALIRRDRAAAPEAGGG